MKDLLLLLSTFQFKKENPGKLAALLKVVEDWNLFVRLLNAHGIIALASHNIRNAGQQNLVPPDTMSALDNGLRQSLVRNIWLKEKWKEADVILSSEGIRHILLKGMALEHTVYGTAGLRQMSDADIFIEPKDSWRAWHLLIQNGFQSEIIKSSLYKLIKSYPGKHLPELHKDGFSLEIHTQLPGIIPENFDDISDIIQIDGRKAFTLKNELHYKYLIEHFDRHLREGKVQLRMFTDLFLLNPACDKDFPESFLFEPDQSAKRKFRNAQYQETVRSVSSRYRLIYILGDTFPSLKWMKQRYKCNALEALIRYPARVFKVFRLI